MSMELRERFAIKGCEKGNLSVRFQDCNPQLTHISGGEEKKGIILRH